MEFRYLGNSGLKISEITYGNWLTHGSQVENDTATECVRAALDAGISSFDTADVYANTAAETVLGEALKGERRESLEIFTKVYWPTGPGGKNDTGLSRKHIMESINGSLKRLQTDYVDLYQAHRFDTETPLEETMQALRRRRTPGQGALHRRQRVDRRPDPRGSRARQGTQLPADLQPAAVFDAVARDRARGDAGL
jgi:aryl-alcohol dehydrogenase-like predicted oxidoreductase